MSPVLRSFYIMNEIAAKGMGWTPKEAVGKIIYHENPGIVKAVVQDKAYNSRWFDAFLAQGPVLFVLDY